MAITTNRIVVGAASLIKIDGTDIGSSAEIQKTTTFYDVVVDQASAKIRKHIVDETFIVTMNLAENIMDSLRILWNQAAGDLVSSSLQIKQSTNPAPEHTLEIACPGPLSKTRTYYFARAVSMQNGGHRIVKDGMQLLPVQFECLLDTTLSPVRWGTVVDA
jgi:hypothetical protein